MQKQDVFWLCGVVIVLIPGLALLVPMSDDRASLGQAQVQNAPAAPHASRT